MLRLVLITAIALGAGLQRPIVNTPSDDADAVYLSRAIKADLLICVQHPHQDVYACDTLDNIRTTLLNRRKL